MKSVQKLALQIDDEQSMLDFAHRFAKQLSRPACLALTGDVGTGKTTFTRGLAEALGITEPVTSPSFTISKRYALPSGGELIHYDFYRLDDPGIMRDDLSEALAEPSSIVVIEWGQDVQELLPAGAIKITLKLLDSGARSVEIQSSTSQTLNPEELRV